MVDVTRKHHLTPKANKFYQKVLDLKRQVRIINTRNISLKSRLHLTERYFNDGFWQVHDLNDIVKNFFRSQIRNVGKQKYHRSYTIKDKIFALALLKQNPKTFRYLSKLFYLPSTETLQKVIRHIPIKTGICKAILDNMRFRISKLNNPTDKYCILLFDEMSLQPGLYFSKYEDIVDGFVDNGFDRKNEVADDVLVWMLRSVSNQNTWKQPLGYTFCKSTTSSEDIVRQFKNIVREVHDTGFVIVASICDQGATNVKSIRQLITDSKRDAFHTGTELRSDIICIDNNIIVPLYDPPHLLKCIRNNLLTKNLKFEIESTKRTAKWSHILDAYYIDCSRAPWRLMPKLSDSHVIPSKIKKMKVSCCTQVFSKTVASTIMTMSEDGSVSKCKQFKMVAEAEDTGLLLGFFDELFDSINGGTRNRQYKQMRLKTSTGDECQQEKVWDKALRVLNSMEFEKRKSSDQAKPAVLQNFILTIQNFKFLRKHLGVLGFGSFATRAFNQDPLENFFGQVRQHGARNTNPTCSTFSSYYKSLLLNNFSKWHSSSANCEKDYCTNLLTTIENFVTTRINTAESDSFPLWELPNLPQGYSCSKPLNDYAVAYVGGFIARHVVPKANVCDICSNNLLHNGPPVDIHKYVVQKDSAQKLLMVNVSFLKCLVSMTNIVLYYMPIVSYRLSFSKLLKKYILDSVEFGFAECSHSETLKLDIVSLFVNTTIYNYLNLFNGIIHGTRFLPSDADNLLKTAKAVYDKRRR